MTSASAPISASRLQKAPPYRNTSGTHQDGQFARKPLPTLPRIEPCDTIFRPDVAAQHGIFLPPPPIGGADYTLGPSSPNWSPSRSDSRDTSPDSRPSTPRTPVIESPIGLPRGTSSTLLTPSGNAKDEKKSRRKSWFGRSRKDDVDQRGPPAWIVGHRDKVPFNLSGLQAGQVVSCLFASGGLGISEQSLGTRTVELAGRLSSLPFSQVIRSWSIVPCRLFHLCLIPSSGEEGIWRHLPRLVRDRWR